MKRNIEQALSEYVKELNADYRLKKLSPHAFQYMNEFLNRSGKRLRSLLFSISYLGFSSKPSRKFYRCAASLELLHNFILIHDDIIDKADLRKGHLSLHALIDEQIKSYRHIKFTGSDLALILGDIFYAFGIKGFMSIQEALERKQKALDKLLDASVYTGSGQCMELLLETCPPEKTQKSGIYKVYDLKTSHYTFCLPLCAGAILAGVRDETISDLERCGIYLGRAFQIKDDVLGLLGNEKETGKSFLTDLKESKRTVLAWYAFHHLDPDKRSFLKKVFEKKTVSQAELSQARDVIMTSGAIKFAAEEIRRFRNTAVKILKGITIKEDYMDLLMKYLDDILDSRSFNLHK